KDFNLYASSTSYNKFYSRLAYYGADFIEFVSLNVYLFKNGNLVASEYTYADFETYGNSGMCPNTETVFWDYIDKSDCDSVAFSVDYTTSDGSKPKFNKHAIIVTNSLINPSGSQYKFSGIIKNLSATPLKFPIVILGVYIKNKMMLYELTFADAADNTLMPGQICGFWDYIDAPSEYDSLKFLPGYSLSLTGDVIITDILSCSIHAYPKSSILFQNYPNPFNSTTTIKYDIDKPQMIRLDIYNINGKLIKNVFNEFSQSGNFIHTFDMIDIASGNYFCVLSGEYFISKIKITLVK
ncbi:T9SS type A sorting domain-containing protein, partial [candidate division KSB1 bacterium]|nr:T9SS type A sorting domain-containing protein [candidate division KSB1 bacterium]